MKPDTKEAPAPAQLLAYIDKLDPKIRKLFGIFEQAVRNIPTANELVYDYSDALVIGYAQADKGIDAIVAIRTLPPVSLCILARDRNWPTRTDCCTDRENRWFVKWKRQANWRSPTW